ncbi:CgeB family protein [Lichenifustis flavocetrariae]|uniref:Glycosyltransferase n=1 Tax=Lichenifustis flavocetrariae TaxID=2949735 RepID=A0AA41Z0R7_9HYPH|nr:glycosyltransferase [Lichenifustis flavocetrariae]MCW6507182.1 glycosyltransferase [Lichenifustis flavocetrariae]
MKLVVVGLSLSSSWGNGHATTYRSLLRAFAARGHVVTFLERDVPWYSGPARDLHDPDYCKLSFYEDLAGLQDHAAEIAAADAVIVGSYVPDGQAVGRMIQETARGVTAFYDIDTPVTIAAVEAGRCAYLGADQIAGYDLYLSFTGGPMLHRLRNEFGSPQAVALYCCADPAVYRPSEQAKRWDLSYLGTYSDDRHPVLDRLLLQPARQAPHLRFVVAGSQYPGTIAWPANVERIEHVSPHDHAGFYGASRFTLNVTRADMVRAGFSPSVRLFEAGACATPTISDRWMGIETVFTPGESILLATTADDVLGVLDDMPPENGRLIGERARAEVLARHTAAHRALELEAALSTVRIKRRAS